MQHNSVEKFKGGILCSLPALLEQMGVEEAVGAVEREVRWMSQSKGPGRISGFTPTGYVTLDNSHSLSKIHSPLRKLLSSGSSICWLLFSPLLSAVEETV